MGKIEKYWKKIIYKRENILDKFLFFILIIFSQIYQLVWELYLKFYELKILKKKKYNLKVVSVGNITLGGTGKTSFVETITKFLKDENINVAILSRGYAGKKKYQSFLVKENSLLSEVGDEPYLLAKTLKVPVVIGKNRCLSTLFSIEKFSPSTLILDDGFQYQKLQKDLEIILIDATSPFGNYKIFPAGILRESLSSLKRANLIVLTKVDQVEKEKKEKLKKIIIKYTSSPILESVYIPLYLRDFFENYFPLDSIKNKEIICFSGIGNSYSFIKTVENLGVKNIINIEFPDHYFYTEKDIKKIKIQQEEGKFKVITTEKDAVRIKKELFSECQGFLILGVEMKIISGEEILKERLLK